MRIVEKIGFLIALLTAIAAMLLGIFYLAYPSSFSSFPEFIHNAELFKQDIIANYASVISYQYFQSILVLITLFCGVFIVVYSPFYIWTHRESYIQRKLLQKAFSHYISPSIIKDIMNRPESLVLGGKSAYLTAYFVDINNFSDMTLEYHPKKIMEYLNEYFSVMSDIILENEGTIDKYEGDAIMAFWGAPKPQENHAYLACKTALLHQKAAQKLRNIWKQEGKPEFYIKIGIASGDMVVGNIGSKGHFNYTIIGRAVNYGVQIQNLNKVYGTKILVSEKTYHNTKHDFEFREIDEIELKSTKTPVRIFELISEKGVLKGNELELINNYHEALESLRNKDIKRAKECIQECLRIAPEDNPSHLLKAKIFSAS